MLIFVGVTVGIVLTILFMTMIILYCVKTQACCCRLDSSSKHKPSDVERYVFLRKEKKGKKVLHKKHVKLGCLKLINLIWHFKNPVKWLPFKTSTTFKKATLKNIYSLKWLPFEIDII